MLTKTIYVIVDLLAIADLIFTYRASRNIKEQCGGWLRRAMIVSVIAISASILVACSFNTLSAEIAYSIYFLSIDWIILFLSAFCLSYTEHFDVIRKLSVVSTVIMAADTVSIALNVLFGHVFYIVEKTDISGSIFYQTKFHFPYYIHLAIDYIALGAALFSIIYRIFKSYSMYRAKYVIILGVLLFTTVLNIIYMAFELLLDASVIFYAVAATLTYICIQTFVPRSLMNISVGRAINDMNEGLILFDLSNNCIYANNFSKNRFDIIENEYGFDKEPIVSVVRTLKEEGTTYGTTTYLRDPDNESGEEHYRIKYNELADKKGNKIGSFFLIEDTTEEFHYLEEIREAKNNADAANNAKSVFLANMSHEIRTPLNSVLGLNEMILRTTDDPQLKEYAENIRVSGDTLLGLINDILDFSKIEANRMDVVCDKYDPHKLLRDCNNYFDQMALEKGLYIKIDCDENMPSSLIGDEKLIRQIMTNIISNAIKYTNTGGVTVRMSKSIQDSNKVLLNIDISDTGIGIDHDDVEAMFDAFRRVNEKVNATIQGTGLGLAITKELITLMNGSINVDSTPGKGSTFFVTLPQRIGDPKPRGKYQAHPDENEKKDYRESFHAPDAHILIVDDSKMNLTVAKALLKNTLIKTDTATGGKQAIEMCRTNKYDVILLDHRMPEPDGIETFKVIKREGANTGTPVVMLTANVVRGAEEEYTSLGFSGYLSKPIISAELEDALRKLLPEDKIIKEQSDK